MRGIWLGLLLATALPACSKPGGSGDKRAEVRVMGPASVQIIPAPDQLEYCLVFTASENGIVRRLTMPPNRLAVPCPAGQPIGGLTYRIPPAEGKVKIYVLFSDQQIKGDPIGTQVYEVVSAKRQLTGMDLRVGGKVQIETLEFTPSAVEVPVVQGEDVTLDAGAPDAAAP